jgi:predicted TIM-barrel fold metal-dependent hydrolase
MDIGQDRPEHSTVRGQENRETSLPVVNCHTHIFTGDYVAPYLAKTFVPVIYGLLNVQWIIGLIRTVESGWISKIIGLYYLIRRISRRVRALHARSQGVRILSKIGEIWLTLHALLIIIRWFGLGRQILSWFPQGLDPVLNFFWENILYQPVFEWNVGWQILFVALIALLFKLARNLILFLIKYVARQFKLLPGKLSGQMITHYYQLGEFGKYRSQSNVFGKLQRQYTPGTHFVILPMDMKYMGAGAPRYSYDKQMEGLATLATSKKRREIFHPFIFADPRRIAEEQDHFIYTVDKAGTVVPQKGSTIHKYLEVKKFEGIKIYPALGYYPFDVELLPLWKYAADQGIPIMTHCVRGPLYYRGRKKTEWNQHPVYKNRLENGNDVPDEARTPLWLSERKNSKFTVNFTHPLNYLVLLEECLLRKLINKYVWDLKVKENQAKTTEKSELYRQKRGDLIRMFGYKNADTPLEMGLSHLKICLAHFGGDEEWMKFMERDRSEYSLELIKHPRWGINFCFNDNGDFSWNKLAQIWYQVDWYSIISSLLLQFPNVYSDISYIVHDQKIYNLLKRTIHHLRDDQKPPSNLSRLPTHRLGERILYGTDFFVVRNHKSDKQMLIDTMANLSTDEFDLIARHNPRRFLNFN